MKHVSAMCRKTLLADLEGPGRADLRSAGDKGGAFLFPPTEKSHLLPDEHFMVAVRLRLQVLHPAALGTRPPASTCGHRSSQMGHRCDRGVDDRGHHGLTCEVGGGVVRRHDSIRDWLAAWIAATTGAPVLTEQFVPKWNRVVEVDGEEQIERARLDVVFNDQTPGVLMLTSASPLLFPLALNCSGREQRGMARRPRVPRTESVFGTQGPTWCLSPSRHWAAQATTPLPSSARARRRTQLNGLRSSAPPGNHSLRYCKRATRSC